jgi:hypothetical protein
MVQRHTLASVVHGAEVVLGTGIALLCSLAIPRHSRRKVLRHAAAEIVHEAEVELGDGVAFVCKRTQQAECCRVVAIAGSSDPILERPRGCRASGPQAQDQQQLQQAHGVSPKAAPCPGGT